MKQECPTYLKTIRKSKALAATLSDTKLEDDSDNEDDGILNAFTTTVNPTERIVEVEFEREEISIKFVEANQTIGALRFENNFLVEKTKKVEVELFQVKAQLERTSSAKLDEMLSLQKSASDRTGLGYDSFSPSIAASSSTIFVPPTNNVETKNNNVKNELASENINNDKSILRAPPKLDKKGIKNPIAKKGNTQKPK